MLNWDDSDEKKEDSIFLLCIVNIADRQHEHKGHIISDNKAK